jgi:cytochrome d ubiquinol oxidase subunit I
MKVEDAATGNEGVWVTFIAVVLLYAGVATALTLVLRSMSRRWRNAEHVDETDVPYGPSPEPQPEEVPVGG